MTLRRLANLGICAAILWTGSAFAQTTFQVGGGLTADIQAAFVAAYQRNGFSTLVGSPLSNVTTFGSTGLVQTFPGAANKGLIYAIVKPDTTATQNAVQVLQSVFYFYNFVTPAVAGYPTADTASCPQLKSPALAGNSCLWQPFGNDYALFVYSQNLPAFDEQFLFQIAMGDPFYTAWNKVGGVAGLGPASSQYRQYVSLYGSGGTFVDFDQGVIYNMTAGPATGQLLTVKEPLYDIYAGNGAESGTMGFPVTAEMILPDGTHQQDFERGAIGYNPTTGVATLLPAVAKVSISSGASIQMYPGEKLAAQAVLAGADGSLLANRLVVWNTSNAKAVQILGTGAAVTLSAIGAGTAIVTATSEGQISPPLNVTVTTSFCCQIGQNAPTVAIQEAFQDAVAREALNVQVPAATGVTRVGNGYVQQLTSASGAAYLIALADNTSTGYVVSGAILLQYLALGGPAGALGYPLADATAGGRQNFQNGALAGTPPLLVTGAILSGWQALGYETGAAGSPTAAVASFLTFRGTTGAMQMFQNGPILAPSLGPQVGQAFLVTGLILARYNASGGPAGNLGAPTTAQRLVNNLQRQDFEGGYVTYAPGDAKAVETDTPRQPGVTATPSAVRAGSAVHLVIGGFNNGATIRVSQTGLADFLVTTANGSYTWDTWVPATTAAGSITVKATDNASATATAQASYTVYATSPSAMTVSVVSGDQQTGAPGAMLSQPLVVMVKDQDGAPVAGQTVVFAASPGAQLLPASAVTGANGQASASLRMPASPGIALATAKAGSQLVTFSAKSAAFSLSSFPALTQAVSGKLGNGSDTIQNKGALLTAAAAILRYHQSRGELPQPNGLADPVSLNQFLASFCATDPQGKQVCDGFVLLGTGSEQTVNLWRVGAFVANDVTVQLEPATPAAIADLVAAGSPVLLALSLNGIGSHFVVATGIAADGSLTIMDPNPAFAQTNLNAYLGGFSAGGQNIQGTLTGAVRLLPQAPALPGFLIDSTAPVTLSSAGGACGTLQFPNVAAVAGAAPTTAPGTIYFGACDGSAGLYELDAGGTGAYSATFTDLALNGRSFLSGAAPAASEVLHSGQQWNVSPLNTLIAGSVLNAASFTTGIAPGGFISIFGAGLAGSGTTTVQINGQSAKVLAATPFQVNAQVPSSVAPGTQQLTVTSSHGSAQLPVLITAVAPAIFSVGANQAAITNQDNSLNTPSNPAKRGNAIVIYGTGFGAVSAAGTATAPVSAVIGGIEIPAAYGGASPGTPGLNQANILLPATLPPGLSLPLYLKQSGVVSNIVTVAIQ